MSIKIKINWKNENAVSESIRIYRAGSEFTPASLPPIFAEITGDIYSYEDLDVIQSQTYFYMLSTVVSEVEVFTECFEVVAENNADHLKLTLPAINASTIVETSFLSGGFTSANSIVFNNDSGDFIVGGVISSGVYGLKRFNSAQGLIETLQTSHLADSFSLSRNGLKLFVRGSGEIHVYQLTSPFVLTGAVFLNKVLNYAGLSEANTSTIFVNPKVTLSKIYSATNLILTNLATSYDLTSATSSQTVDVLSKLTLRSGTPKITGILMSDDGSKLWVTTGSWSTTNQRFHVLNLSTPFDLNTAVQASFKDITVNFTRGSPIGFNLQGGFAVFGNANGGLIKLDF